MENVSVFSSKGLAISVLHTHEILFSTGEIAETSNYVIRTGSQRRGHGNTQCFDVLARAVCLRACVAFLRVDRVFLRVVKSSSLKLITN